MQFDEKYKDHIEYRNGFVYIKVPEFVFKDLTQDECAEKGEMSFRHYWIAGRLQGGFYLSNNKLTS